ncbi:MAG TPA: glycosyl hydrolase-related protein, partial [Chloroflexia bacterium]|nr:glycosyl hydrolase-related protein [Chloroflexia bacterium]
SPGIFAFEPARVPSRPTIYAHLSNTQWGTNFPQWLEGDFKFRVRLAPHAGDWRTGELWGQTSSLDLNELHMRGERGVGSMPSLVERDTGLLLLSLHPAHVGRGLIARYWDALGTHRKVTLSLPQPVARVWRCDLMERPVEELPLQKRPASDPSHKPVSWGVLHVAPHATVTLLLEFDKPQEAAP